MVALKLENFGGMVPAVDDRLLPPNAAADSENAWVYTGAIEGFREPVSVYTMTNPKTRRVFRIPKDFYDKQHIPDSYWMEFENPDTNVIYSPVVDDQYDRYYWASGQAFNKIAPRYNTKARIANGDSSYLLGIPTPTVAPKVSRLSGAYVLSAIPFSMRQTGYSANMYYSTKYGVDADTFYNGPIPDPPNRAGQYEVDGSRAELRYGTTVSGSRVTIADDGTVTLGIPTQPTLQTKPVTPTDGNGVLESRAYVYTWVSAYGEEGAPSPATVQTGWSDDPWVIQVAAPGSSVTTDRNITKVRIYRTVTSSVGSATYYYVGEMSINQTVFNDSVSTDTLVGNNILDSTFYTPPPADLEGMIAMPNGIIAGWRKNEIWFCEPYLPHAWPTPYVLAVEYPVIGLGVIGQSLIVCTAGYPYAISGINPSNMAMSRIATYEPCMSRGSIISTEYGVLYASPNGIVRAVAGTVEVVTKSMITKDHWQDLLEINTLRAAKLLDGYYCWGSVQAGCFDPLAFNNSSFLLDDYSGAYTGAFIDFLNQRVSYNRLQSDDPTFNVLTDVWTGEILLVRGAQVYWLDISDTRPHGPYLWRSKIFTMPNQRNLEAMRIFFDTYIGTDENDYGKVRVYANGRQVFERQMRSSGEFMRLPSGFKATHWQIEVEGSVRVYSVETATSAKELGSV